MIDTNTAAGWCSRTHTHMQTHTYPTSSDAHAYACPLWFMHPDGGVSLSESKANTQVSSFVNQLPIYGCVCVSVCVRVCKSLDVCAYKSVCMCVWVEVSVGNRLIITVAPSFIIFIEFFPASALGVCKSRKFYTMGCHPFSVCVCIYVCVPSHVRWVLTTSANQRSDPALCSRKSPNFLTSLIIPREGWGKAFRKTPSHQSGCQLMGSPWSLLSCALDYG